MNTDFRYQLETRKLTGRNQQKFTCPHCGRKKCFVRYVDTHHDCRYIADDVGKCDHQHSCGYHYKPSEYYKDNQWDAERDDGNDTTKHCTPVILPPFQAMPMEYVVRSHSPRSTFWQWLSTDVAHRLNIPSGQIQRVYKDYHIGATRMGDVIFWQIDQRQQVHGGHIMQYRADGHREGFQGWTHIPLIRKGLLPLDWQLYQCLYGEHLLCKYPDAHVCLVESEKTALVMAAYMPQHLWLATAGSGGLSAERVKCLAGRNVTLFPDSGCYEKWCRQMEQASDIDYSIDKQLESYPPNTDLCDILLNSSSPQNMA